MESRPDHGQKGLLEEFQPITDAQWEEKLLSELKGKPLTKLNWDSAEGFKLKAYYRESDIEEIISEDTQEDIPGRRGDVLKAGNPGWQIVQAISLQEVSIARNFLQKSQEAEIKAFLFEEDGSNLLPLIPSLDLGRTSFHLRLDHYPQNLGQYLGASAVEQGTKLEWITGTCFYDVFSSSITTNKQIDTQELENLKQLIFSTKAFPYLRSLGIDVSYVLDQGGNCSQQLGLALATALEYLMHFSQEGIDPDKLLSQMAFLFSTGGSFFMEIAKLRAFRLLFGRLLELLEVEAATDFTPFILSTNTSWNKSQLDRHNNLLRATTEATSAVLGGAHAVVLRPFDGQETEFGQRLARNIQQLLEHESYLGKVIDPGGGSYYLEKMTEALAKRGWEFFQQIEKEGGIQKAHHSGFIRGAIDQVKNRQLERLLTTKQSLIGVNRYPNQTEEIDPTILMQVEEGASSPFEQIRKETLQLTQSRGKAFTASLILFGNPKMRSARATFCENIMGVLGWNTSQFLWEEGSPLPTMTDIYILCSSDADYPDQAATISQKLTEKGHAAPVLIAGKTDQLSKWGASACLYRGMNLQEFHQSLHNLIS